MSTRPVFIASIIVVLMVFAHAESIPFERRYDVASAMDSYYTSESEAWGSYTSEDDDVASAMDSYYTSGAWGSYTSEDDDVASAIGSYYTSEAWASYTPEGDDVADSYYTWTSYTSGGTVILSAVSVGIQEGFSDASTWLASHAAEATRTSFIVATVTPVSGVAGSIVSSVGDPAGTLATSSVGIPTSSGGSQFTVAPTPTSTTNAAANVHSMTLKASPVLATLVTVVGATLLGAWLTC